MTHWRQKPKPKAPKPVSDILRERNERRTAALIASIKDVSSTEGPDAVTHTVVADRAGVPVQYVRWMYPSRETLVAMASA
ncbi:hypothetical protein [Arthrobacter sp. M4]|uniref:hypothetical protein n=1 Tax=Arthrobacter sp. M4 TaxID=218160 RepID=UPI001CDBBF4E|nr:hypothetical protein [Arthrobacter sp. M4]MCA4133899.1 hypothetical protein [Arthrobacter sp. M4]